MTQRKAPKKRTARSTRLSHQTRAARAQAQALLATLADPAAQAALADNSEAQQLLVQLRQDAAVLSQAPKARIVAARRIQGAASRRQHTAQRLFTVCNEVRRRIKVRFRGPRHAALRRAFGEGIPANPAKPVGIADFAQRVLAAAPFHSEALAAVRVGPPTLRSIEKMLAILQQGRPERTALRGTRRQVVETLGAVAARVNRACEALQAVAPPKDRREA